MKTGKFIVFEGADGTGKSSAVESARDYLMASGHRALIVKNPGATPVGAEIRRLTKSDQHPLGSTIGLLMAADWSETLRRIVIPNLESGIHVLADRYNYVSGLVYNDIHMVRLLYTQILKDSPVCDALFYLKADHKYIVSRLLSRADVPLDHWDRECLKEAGYNRLAERYDKAVQSLEGHVMFNRIIPVDANEPQHKIRGMVARYLDEIV